MAGGRAAVTGRVERIADDVLTRARQARYERRYQDIGDGDPVPFLAGGNAVVRSDVFAAVGGFPDVRSMSDSGIVRRIEASGGSCHFVPGLRVEHWHNHGWRVAAREAFLAGRATPGPIGPSEALRSLRTAVADTHAAADAALVNAGLQAAFLSGHAAGRVTRGPARPAAPAGGRR